MSGADTLSTAHAVEIGWATGVFDAEGTVRVNKGSIEMRIRSTDRVLLDRVAAIFGGHVVGPYGNGEGHAPVYYWTVPAAEAPPLLKLLAPMLSPSGRERVLRHLPTEGDRPPMRLVGP
jgi:hypothetical protein